jgi:hypothetical protein
MTPWAGKGGGHEFQIVDRSITAAMQEPRPSSLQVTAMIQITRAGSPRIGGPGRPRPTSSVVFEDEDVADLLVQAEIDLPGVGGP